MMLHWVCHSTLNQQYYPLELVTAVRGVFCFTWPRIHSIMTLTNHSIPFPYLKCFPVGITKVFFKVHLNKGIKMCVFRQQQLWVRNTYEWGRVGWPEQSRYKVKKSLMTMITMKKYSPSTWLVLGLCRVMLMAGMLWLESGTWPWPPFSTWPRPPPPGRYDLTISSSLSSPVSGPSSESSFHKYFEITQSIVRRKRCQETF